MTYTARSASDKTDDWPLWYVANETGLNVTQQLTAVPQAKHGAFNLQPFLPRAQAEMLAETANKEHK